MFNPSVSGDLQSSKPSIIEVSDPAAAARWAAIERRYALCLARIAADPEWIEAELAEFYACVWRWERRGYPFERRRRRRKRHGR